MEHYEHDAECKNEKLKTRCEKNAYIIHVGDTTKEWSYQIKIICSTTVDLSHTIYIAVNKRRCYHWRSFVMNSRNTNMLDVMLVNFSEVY